MYFKVKIAANGTSYTQYYKAVCWYDMLSFLLARYTSDKFSAIESVTKEEALHNGFSKVYS